MTFDFVTMAFQCKKCLDKKYSTVGSLNRHTLTEHKEDNRMITVVCPLKCQICFGSQRELRNHLTQFHGLNVEHEEHLFPNKDRK